MNNKKFAILIKERLKKLWYSSDLSIHEICVNLGIKPSDLRKLRNELQLPTRNPSKPKRNSPFGMTKRPIHEPEILEISPKRITRVKVNEPITIEELTSQTCRFPVGDHTINGFKFCGAQVHTKVYCKAHYELCHINASEKFSRIPYRFK